ncbi:uncharacterized protein GLRG_02059 [Colletotrichum graminicola M1.001]|uniref:Uncharacterized protein n=1 Tax=Colletotrichum graminicola (strain M1.001 / M2 / FGSC 10212) TaxID=645133 RepID=E3Q8L7_COLGM|nr:uncharacterized protein GLRG_02059 [Colletotrichum graminicola M1.001]EFQ26888.1 hypothetical protein GLRG_02059 [Colletotrichum graminicola M1.001]
MPSGRLICGNHDHGAVIGIRKQLDTLSEEDVTQFEPDFDKATVQIHSLPVLVKWQILLQQAAAHLNLIRSTRIFKDFKPPIHHYRHPRLMLARSRRRSRTQRRWI